MINITNSAREYSPKVGDIVIAWDGKRKLKGFVESVGLGNFKMYYGPTFPNSHITHFYSRDGKPIVPGTNSLPQDVF